MPQSITEVLAAHGVEDETLAAALSEWFEASLAENANIPKSRFDEVIAQRNELRRRIEEDGQELQALRTQAQQRPPEEWNRLMEENRTLQQQLVQRRLDEWAPYAAWFQPGHPNYEKAQRVADDFRLPQDGQTLTLEQAQHNLGAIQPYLKAGYFVQPAHVDSTPPSGRAPQDTTADLRRVFKTFGG